MNARVDVYLYTTMSLTVPTHYEPMLNDAMYKTLQRSKYCTISMMYRHRCRVCVLSALAEP